MNHLASHRSDDAARVLALITVANGCVKDCELETLDHLDAFTRIGVSRRRFVQLAQRSLDEVGARLSERGHLHMADLLYLDDLLDHVHPRDERLLVARLAAAVITADGRISPTERAAYDHMLARWRLGPASISQAIRADPVR